MLKLSIMSEEELTHIFGDLDSYIPLHEGESSSVLGARWGLGFTSPSPFTHLDITAIPLFLFPFQTYWQVWEKPQNQMEPWSRLGPSLSSG